MFLSESAIDGIPAWGEQSRIMAIDLAYPAILSLFGGFKMKGREEHQAFTAWFLQNYYHLDAIEVDDAMCDGQGDKGIDAIYVNELMGEIDIFQSTMGTRTPLKSLGDVDLKELVGTLCWFKTAETVRQLHMSTYSLPLKALLERLDIARLIEEGYVARGIFITNRLRDQNASTLLPVAPQIVLYDGQELQKQYLPLKKPEPIAKEISFDVNGVGVLSHPIEDKVQLVVAPILASELVKMNGLANQELFAWNLRYQLKNAPVNRDIEESIIKQSEHKYFPAFHNGLTVLAESVVAASGSITIRGYAVVNGCQSLRALYHKAANISKDLRILTKFVSVSPRSALAQKITDHTNRQNGIVGRDLQSNNSVQTRIQTDVHNEYEGRFFYRIARGEHFEWDELRVIENDEAARIMLAFDLKDPASCHQKYKLFDELHGPIFGRKEVNADRVVTLWKISKIVKSELDNVEDRLFAGYSLTQFLVLYLLREVLELSESGGREFCKDPTPYVRANDGFERVNYTVTAIVHDIVKMVVATEGQMRADGSGFEYKKDLKTASKIGDFKTKVLPFYQTAVNSRFARPFRVIWKESEREWKQSLNDFRLTS